MCALRSSLYLIDAGLMGESVSRRRLFRHRTHATRRTTCGSACRPRMTRFCACDRVIIRDMGVPSLRCHFPAGRAAACSSPAAPAPASRCCCGTSWRRCRRAPPSRRLPPASPPARWAALPSTPSPASAAPRYWRLDAEGITEPSRYFLHHPTPARSGCRAPMPRLTLHAAQSCLTYARFSRPAISSKYAYFIPSRRVAGVA